MSTNPWDGIAISLFNTTVDNLHPVAADNILIAHPAMWEIIRSQMDKTTGQSALDFGTGTGGFAKELAEQGFCVTAIDTSPEMIDIARQRNIPGVSFIHGDIDRLDPSQRFHLITSVMVAQFIRDFSTTLRTLCTHLHTDGLLIIAVHHPEYIKECLAHGYKFERQPATDQCHIRFNPAVSIPLYDRTLADYQTLFTKQPDLKQIAVAEPPFSPAFIQQYGASSGEPLHVNKYLIIALKKIAP